MNEILETLKLNQGKLKFSELYGPLADKWDIKKRTFWIYLDDLRTENKITYPIIWIDVTEPDVPIMLVEENE
ncbi:hypothetical protein JXL21_09815 [Candidatus Bathyarchaeota archaeon]|nr:hypothetical protein [Candidatus Bathyarchaeota archaeon]